MKKTTIGDLERETGQQFQADPQMTLSAWLRRNGLPAGADLVDKLESERGEG